MYLCQYQFSPAESKLHLEIKLIVPGKLNNTKYLYCSLKTALEPADCTKIALSRHNFLGYSAQRRLLHKAKIITPDKPSTRKFSANREFYKEISQMCKPS